MRKIIHVDMDCFYAAIEARDNPDLRGKAIAVGGSSPRAVITTASYEARKFGVKSAMPVYRGRELCPHLILVPHRFEAYKEASRQVRGIFQAYTDKIEPLSLDEAFLDVTGHARYGWSLAKEIRHRIREETGLTASAGIATNKMLAKIASDWRKPDGQFAIRPEDVEDFMKPLPVKRIWGVGPVMTGKLKAIGIETCGQLQELSRFDLGKRFGSWGEELYEMCRGLDNRPVDGNRLRKSLSCEYTFDTNLQTLDECKSALAPILDELMEDLRKKASSRVIVEAVVKVKFSDFRQTTRQCRCLRPEPAVFHRLLEEAWERSPDPVRLLGAGVRFADPEKSEGDRQLLLRFERESGPLPEETISSQGR